MRIEACMIERATRGYLASNQLSRLLSASPAHLEATVVTAISVEKRKFSWLWVRKTQKALLVNRLTGTLFDPETGQGLNSEPHLVGAPFKAPSMNSERLCELPRGVFSTSEK